MEELVQLAPEIRENLWVGTNFYYTADTPVAREFVKNYQAKFGDAAGLRALGRLLHDPHAARGVRQGEVRRRAGVIKALEGIEVNDLLGRMRVEPATHQTLRPYFFLRCKPKSAMKHELDFADIIATGDTPLPKEYAACKDIGGF